MSKREEYNIKFYKKTIDGRTIDIFDTKEAIGNYKYLFFIFNLAPVEIENLIQEINSIQQNQPYDHDFMEQSEIYGIFEVTFSNPDFYVCGENIINMNDLKLLLEEWLDFIDYKTYIYPKSKNLRSYIKFLLTKAKYHLNSWRINQ